MTDLEAEAKGLHSSQPISYYTGMIVCLISTPEAPNNNSGQWSEWDFKAKKKQYS